MTVMRYDDDHGVRIGPTGMSGVFNVYLHTRPICGPSVSEDGEDWPSEHVGTVRKERERGRRGGWRDVWRPIEVAGRRHATRRTRQLAAAQLARAEIERDRPARRPGSRSTGRTLQHDPIDPVERANRARRAGKLDRDK